METFAVCITVAAIVLVWSESCRARDCSGTGGDVGPCKCKGNGDRINIELGEAGEMFAEEMIDDDDDLRYTYKLSLCEPITCGTASPSDATAVACQVGPQGAIRLGKVSSYMWNITSNDRFTITYGDGEPLNDTTDRQVRVEFTAEPYSLQPTIAFAGQDGSTNTYVFQAEISKGEDNIVPSASRDDLLIFTIAMPVIILILPGLICVVISAAVLCALMFQCYKQRKANASAYAYVVMPPDIQ